MSSATAHPAPAPAAPTIQALKLRFLAAQTALLSQPASTSAAWRAANSGAAFSPGERVPQQALDDALADLNVVLQRHARRVYPPQAAANVAEQIDALYAAEAEARVAGRLLGGMGGMGEGVGAVGREVDLTEDAAIEQLPPQWDADETFAEKHPAEAKRYADAVARLQRLAEQRRDVARRVKRLRSMHAAVAPFKTDSPSAEGEAGVKTGGGAGAAASAESAAGVERLQENLVTRNGEMEKELERMRVLLARVTGRVLGLPDGQGQGAMVEDVARKRKRDVDEFLADAGVFPD